MFGHITSAVYIGDDVENSHYNECEFLTFSEKEIAEKIDSVFKKYFNKEYYYEKLSNFICDNKYSCYDFRIKNNILFSLYFF